MKIYEITESLEFSQPAQQFNTDFRPDMELAEDDLEEGPVLDKAKKAVAVAGAAIGLAAMAPQAHADTSFNARAGDAKYAQMQQLQNSYFQQFLQDAKESGAPITADLIRRLRTKAQMKAVDQLST